LGKEKGQLLLLRFLALHSGDESTGSSDYIEKLVAIGGVPPWKLDPQYAPVVRFANDMLNSRLEGKAAGLKRRGYRSWSATG